MAASIAFLQSLTINPHDQRNKQCAGVYKLLSYLKRTRFRHSG